MATIFVTGASGFVGRNLIRALRARGDEVRALARSDQASAVVSNLGALPMRADLDSPTEMRAAMRGCDLVIHAAALVVEWGPRAAFERVHVTGTRNVLSAARDAGVRSLVHVSTEAVLGDGKPLVRIDETYPIPARPFPRYCATKAAAEGLVLAANDAHLRTVVVRPRMIWGADDTSLLPQFVEAANQGRFMWFGDGRYLTSTCHVANVVDGTLRAAEVGRGGEVYFLTDGEPIVFRDFFTRMLATQGVTLPEKRIPFGVAKVIAAVSEGLWNTLRLPGKPPITRTVVCMMGQEVTIVDAKARRELGYSSPTTVEAGLRDLETRTPAAHERR